eukprot:NODE_18_length_40692_cov_0.469183.p13 type:complete len:317 gc:universal NODE_18_length_40692_cov_0.469183:25841-26791(+)
MLTLLYAYSKKSNGENADVDKSLTNRSLGKSTIEHPYNKRTDRSHDKQNTHSSSETSYNNRNTQPVSNVNPKLYRHNKLESYTPRIQSYTRASGQPGISPRPNYGYSKPAPDYGYSKPAPSYGYSKPASNYGYSKPAPSYGYSKPAPSYGHSKPAPSYGHSKPAPSYGHSKPAPSYGHSKPAPSYGHSKPAPSYGNSRSTSNYIPTRPQSYKYAISTPDIPKTPDIPHAPGSAVGEPVAEPAPSYNDKPQVPEETEDNQDWVIPPVYAGATETASFYDEEEDLFDTSGHKGREFYQKSGSSLTGATVLAIVGAQLF